MPIFKRFDVLVLGACREHDERAKRPLSRDLERLALVTRISSLDHAMPAAYREKMRMLADELDGLMGKAMALEAGNG